MRNLTLLFCLLINLALQAESVEKDPFWLGADISGTTMHEKHGRQMYNANGDTRENTQ